MKKIILLIALLPFNVFASEKTTAQNPNTYAMNNKCENLTDPVERKDCLIIEKKSEARENYKNFQENNHSAYQENF